MNAKEEIIQMLIARKGLLNSEYHKFFNSAITNEGKEKVNKIFKKKFIELDTLITATEKAIFDVPSLEEIEAEKEKLLNDMMIDNYQVDGFVEGVNFILNYKKT